MDSARSTLTTAKIIAIENEYREASSYIRAQIACLPVQTPMVEVYYERLPLLLRRQVPRLIRETFDEEAMTSQQVTPPTVTIALWLDFMHLREARGVHQEASKIFMAGITVQRVSLHAADETGAGTRLTKECNRKFMFGLCAGPNQRVGKFFRDKILADMQELASYGGNAGATNVEGGRCFELKIESVDYPLTMFY
jgi:hypothetical protein